MSVTDIDVAIIAAINVGLFVASFHLGKFVGSVRIRGQAVERGYATWHINWKNRTNVFTWKGDDNGDEL